VQIHTKQKRKKKKKEEGITNHNKPQERATQELVGDMAGLAINPVQVYRTKLRKHEPIP
jgi:hypothetical protein